MAPSDPAVPRDDDGQLPFAELLGTVEEPEAIADPEPFDEPPPPPLDLQAEAAAATHFDLEAAAAAAPPGAPPRPSFQAAAGIQGRQFAEQCDTLLHAMGFTLRGRRVLDDVGIEIDQEAWSPGGITVWFEYKGSVQGNRPGLRRTDTLKKAIANGALLRALHDPAPYLVITSHLPEAGSGAAMLETALRLGYVADVVCLYDPKSTQRLRRW